MKLGDKVRSKKRDGVATIIDVNIKHIYNDFTNKSTIRTTYLARYDNGQLLKFYGYDIGKRVFKANDYVQLSLFDENNNIIEGK